MRHGVISSQDLGGPDNPHGRLSPDYLLLVQGLKAATPDLEQAATDLAQYLKPPARSDLLRAIQAAEQPADITATLRQLLAVPTPSPALTAGLEALARFYFTREANRVAADAAALQARADRMRQALAPVPAAPTAVPAPAPTRTR